MNLLSRPRLAEIRDEVDSLHLFIEEPACYHCAVHDLLEHIDALQAQLTAIGRSEQDCFKNYESLKDAKLSWENYALAGWDKVDHLRAVLTRIQQWDELNPPNTAKIGDAQWLRDLVDTALENEQ